MQSTGSYMSVFSRASSDGMSEITSYMWSGEDASSLEVSALSWCLVFLRFGRA